MNWEEEQQHIQGVIKRFPDTFYLPQCEKRIKIAPTACYFSGETLYLYTVVESQPDRWESYCKGTEQELKRAIARRCWGCGAGWTFQGTGRCGPCLQKAGEVPLPELWATSPLATFNKLERAIWYVLGEDWDEHTKHLALETLSEAQGECWA
jgi:hypothetical protein